MSRVLCVNEIFRIFWFSVLDYEHSIEFSAVLSFLSNQLCSHTTTTMMKVKMWKVQKVWLAWKIHKKKRKKKCSFHLEIFTSQNSDCNYFFNTTKLCCLFNSYFLSLHWIATASKKNLLLSAFHRKVGESVELWKVIVSACSSLNGELRYISNLVVMVWSMENTFICIFSSGSECVHRIKLNWIL